MAETLNSGAWDAFFRDEARIREIENRGFLDIGAQELKTASMGREPRHLAKMDSSSERPEIFKKLEVNIFPLSRSKYRIGKFNCFHNFPSFDERSALPVKFMQSPSSIESLDFSNISSESSAIYAAQLGGIYEDFLGEKFTPTFSGRQGTKKFIFSVNSYSQTEFHVEVDKAQIEIDGGFEGPSKVVLVEAKNSWRDDFNIRQLYFPYIHLTSRVKKKVVPVYQIYENGIYTLIEYAFKEQNRINSLELMQIQSYAFSRDTVSAKDLLEEISAHPLGFGAPYPQADNFDLLLDLVHECNSEPQDGKRLIAKFGYDERQMGNGGYYPNAAIYLGLISKMSNPEGDVMFRASDFGSQLMELDIADRNAVSAQLILNIPGARNALKKFLAGDIELSTQDVLAELNSGAEFQALGQSTQSRRAQTIACWLKWIVRRDLTLVNSQK